MEKLFKSLRDFLDAKEKALSELPQEDAIVELADMSQEFGDIVSKFIEAASEALLDPENEGSLDDIDVDAEPEYFANSALLAEAAVVTLGIRSDIAGQLSGAGRDDLADEVKKLLADREGVKVEAATRTVEVK